MRWATDDAKVRTRDDAWRWPSTTIDPGSAEGLGHPVGQRGDRFANYKHVARALTHVFGPSAVGAARGGERRHAHGRRDRTDDGPGQSRFPGRTPSFAFVGEPAPHGGVKRCHRTLKPPLSPGHTARHRAELAAAGAACVITEDRDWRFAKLGDKRLRADRRADPPASRLAAQQPWSCVPETRADTARGLSRLTSIHAGAPHGRQPGVRWV